MRFTTWLEEVERNSDYWRRFFLGLWDLNHDGLGMNLQGFDTDRLRQTSEFQSLPQPRQQEIVNRISQGNGTVGDLADIASGNGSF